jgi:hypothetical protein
MARLLERALKVAVAASEAMLTMSQDRLAIRAGHGQAGVPQYLNFEAVSKHPLNMHSS